MAGGYTTWETLSVRWWLTASLLLLQCATARAEDPADRVEPGRLLRTVVRLTATDTRVTGSAGLIEAAGFVRAQALQLGLQVRDQPFLVRHMFEGGAPVVDRNIIVQLGPRSAARLVLVAHLDSKGANDAAQARELGWHHRSDPAPGADDNASGVAALLEVARVLAEADLRCGIDIVFSGAEEMASIAPDDFMDNIGGAILAERYRAERVSILGAIVVDMLLRPRPWGPSLRVYSDGRLGSQVLAEAIELSGRAYAPGVELQNRVVPGFTYSDHGAFWAQGWPAVLLIEDDFHHRRYHRANDVWPAPDFYDPRQLVAGTRIIVGAVAQLCSKAP